MRTPYRLLVAVMAISVLMIGCEEENTDLPFAPLDCQRTKPANGYLNISLTVNSENPKVPITVYRGDIERLTIVEQDSVSIAAFSYELPIDRTYAVTAEYLDGRDTILVIDADRITVSAKEYRDTDCYSTNDGNVDVRLLSKTGTRHVNVREIEDIVWTRLNSTDSPR